MLNLARPWLIERIAVEYPKSSAMGTNPLIVCVLWAMSMDSKRPRLLLMLLMILPVNSSGAVISSFITGSSSNWTAVLNFKEILAEYKRFEEHVLDFKYILFDVSRYEVEELCRAANLVASVFALDSEDRQRRVSKAAAKASRGDKELEPGRVSEVYSMVFPCVAGKASGAA